MVRTQHCAGTSSDAVVAALEELGCTPEEVRETIKSINIKGAAGNGKSCVIAKYINRKIFGLNASVTRGAVHFTDENGKATFVRHPVQITKFIDSFDKGEFPELVNKGE